MAWSLATFLACSSILQANYVELPASKTAPDFKLIIRLFGVSKEARYEADLVVHGGKVYQFVTQRRDEVTIFDSKNARFIILDLKNQVCAHVTMASIAQADLAIREATFATIAKYRKQGDRSGRVLAQMTEDLLDAKFTSQFDPKTSTLVLKNPTVDITCIGEADKDGARLAVAREVLIATALLALVRDPGGLHPSSQVVALRAAIDDRGYLPAESSYYFRLTGTPSLYRWTYEVAPVLTERELVAIRRIDQLLAKTKVITYQEYALLRPTD